MRRDSHIVLGIISAYAVHFPVLPAMVFAVLPDIDVKWSLQNTKKKKAKASLWNSHRGITHHAFLIPILLIPILLINKGPLLFVASACLGYLSHLLADILTKSGIPYWKHKDRIAIQLFATGTFAETLTVGIISLTVIGLLYHFYGFTYIIPRDFWFLWHRI